VIRRFIVTHENAVVGGEASRQPRSDTEPMNVRMPLLMGRSS